MIRRASKVQDGHTPTEQLVYDALCAEAGPYRHEHRLVRAGYGRLATITKLAPKTIARCIAALVRKFAIEVAAPSDAETSTGTSYMIPPFAEVLRKRESEGLTHIGYRGHFISPPAHPATNGTTTPHRQTLQAIDRSRESAQVPVVTQHNDPTPQAGTAAGRITSPRPGDELWGCIRDALRDYVRTDSNGRELLCCDSWCQSPPDDSIVEAVGKFLRWDLDYARRVLIPLKRTGKKPESSYAWFPKVLASRCPTAQAGRQAPDAREKGPEYGQARLSLPDKCKNHDENRGFVGLAEIAEDWLKELV